MSPVNIITEIPKPTFRHLPIIGTEVKPKPITNPGWQLKLFRIYFKMVGTVMPKVAASQALGIFIRPRKRYHTKRYAALLAKAEKFEVISNKLKINGYIWKNNGPTVMLAHGWETGGLHMGAFIEPLWKQGFQVIIFDGPAHGASEGRTATLPDFAQAMLKIYQQVGPIQYMIGHSFGGFASVFLAAEYAQEVDLKKIVLISVPNKLTRVLEDFARVLQLSPRVANQMRQLIKSTYQTDLQDIETSKLGQHIHTEKLLVIHDRYDQVLPFHNALEIAHDLPQAELLETQYLGHNRLLKDSRVIDRVIGFLKN